MTKMKLLTMCGTFLLLAACNNSGKDSVEKADSANKANKDSGDVSNVPATDDGNSAFLVRTANNGMAEVEMASMAMNKANTAGVKDFATMLHTDHAGVNTQVKNLAAQKNVVLPSAISEEKQKDINDLQVKSGNDFDKDFLDKMIAGHEKSIESFEKIAGESTDADVKAFATNTLPALRKHLEAAKTLKKALK